MTVLRLLTCVAAIMPGIANGADLSVDNLPQSNMAKSDELQVRGMLPNDIAVKLYVRWQTTAHVSGCEEDMSYVGPLPRKLVAPVEPTKLPQGAHQWIVWRDAFMAGRCGWMLKKIEVYADSANSDLKIDRQDNIPNMIAYILSLGEKNEEYNWALNDDINKPVYLYCDFSYLHKLDRERPTSLIESTNPCAKGWEKHHGTDSGKNQHILLTGQRVLTFVVDNY